MTKEKQEVKKSSEATEKQPRPAPVVRDDLLAIFTQLKTVVNNAEQDVLKFSAGNIAAGAELKRTARLVRDIANELYRSSKSRSLKLVQERKDKKVAEVAE